MSQLRRFFTRRLLWPTVFAASAGTIIVETAGWMLGWWDWLPGQMHSTLIGTAAISAIMTGMGRFVGPVQEAYRLGMVAGARQERERQQCEAQHRAARSGRVAVGGDTDPQMPAVYRPPLHLVSRD